MIAYPIGTPIGSRRDNPNRPRIAQYESCHFVPKEVEVHPSVTAVATPAPPVLSAVSAGDGWLGVGR